MDNLQYYHHQPQYYYSPSSSTTSLVDSANQPDQQVQHLHRRPSSSSLAFSFTFAAPESSFSTFSQSSQTNSDDRCRPHSYSYPPCSQTKIDFDSPTKSPSPLNFATKARRFMIPENSDTSLSNYGINHRASIAVCNEAGLGQKTHVTSKRPHRRRTTSASFNSMASVESRSSSLAGAGDREKRPLWEKLNFFRRRYSAKEIFERQGSYLDF